MSGAEPDPRSRVGDGRTQVVVADDRGLIRLGIVQVLRDIDPDLEIMEVESVEALLAALAKHVPDLAIMGLGLHDLVLPDSFEQARGIAPNARLIAVLEGDDARLAELCLKAGAAGYVSTASRRDQVAEALRRYLLGEECAPEALPPVATRGLQPGEAVRAAEYDAPLPGLSRRQMNLVRLLAAGRSNGEIATMFGTAEGSVRHDISAILRIFGMGSLRSSHLTRP